MRRRTSRAGMALATVVAALAVAAPSAHAALPSCAAPAAGASPTAVAPEAEGLDPAGVQQALDFASSRVRSSVKIFRNGCLVGQSRVDPVTDRIPMQEFSSTKSVVSLVAGIAIGDGRLDVDAPIGRYLPTGEGWGDAAHRAITVRDLLTETAGLKQSILSEFGSVGNDPNVAKQALALPLIHEPGTYFEYTQRVPDLLAFVVQQAVGEDFQAFAQARLFDPIGISRSSYVWLRDRSGNTYGYANLLLPPRDFARLGLLMGSNGSWNGRQVIPASYMQALSSPSPQNPCYGFLFWVNRHPCTSPSIFSRRTLDEPILPLPDPDAFAMVGALQQNNFIDRSLGLVVTWNGALGDLSSDPQATFSASPHSELYWTFFRKLMAAFREPTLADPGPYVDDPPNRIAPDEFLDPAILLNGFGLGPYAPPGCNVLACDGADLGVGPRLALADAIRLALGAASPAELATLPGGVLSLLGLGPVASVPPATGGDGPVPGGAPATTTTSPTTTTSTPTTSGQTTATSPTTSAQTSGPPAAVAAARPTARPAPAPALSRRCYGARLRLRLADPPAGTREVDFYVGDRRIRRDRTAPFAATVGTSGTSRSRTVRAVARTTTGTTSRSVELQRDRPTCRPSRR